MRRTRTPALLAAGLTAGLLAALMVPGVAQAAAVAVPLPIGTAADVVSAGDRVFVSGGATSTEVVVTNAAGAVVGALSGLPGPTDLLLSNDRRTLFVALPGANAIAAFDTGSLNESARYDTGAGECPSSLALTGLSLWFGYGCDQWGGNIGRVNLNNQPATVTVGVVGENYYDHPLLTAARTNREVLLAGQPSLSPGSVYAYGVGPGGTLTLLRGNEFGAVGENLKDIALDPTGTTLYTAAGWPYRGQAFPFADITTPSRTYQTGPYPNAVELSRDGTSVAVGTFSWYDPDVHVFTADGTAVTNFELGEDLVDRALAWSPNGARLYAVTARFGGADPPVPATLHVLTPTAG